MRPSEYPSVRTRATSSIIGTIGGHPEPEAGLATLAELTLRQHARGDSSRDARAARRMGLRGGWRAATLAPDPRKGADRSTNGGRLNRIWRRRAARLVAVASLAASAFGCAANSATPYEQGANRYQFKFSLSRVSGESGTCTASASVKDLMADRRLSVPIFTARWGEQTTATAVDSAYGARLDVAVTVGATGQSGEFKATLHRGDLLVASRTSAMPVAVVKSKMKAIPE